jgi:hypothetical protein
MWEGGLFPQPITPEIFIEYKNASERFEQYLLFKIAHQ